MSGGVAGEPLARYQVGRMRSVDGLAVVGVGQHIADHRRHEAEEEYVDDLGPGFLGPCGDTFWSSVREK